jgi:mRNA interferase MazF
MISQGEIWKVDLEPTKGDEIGKARPVIVVSSDLIGKLDLKIVAPITNWSKQFQFYPWMFNIKNNQTNGLSKESAIDCFQVKSISSRRFIKKLGCIDDEKLNDIHKVIVKTLNPKYKLN